MTPAEAVKAVQIEIKGNVQTVRENARARLPRAANALRNAELTVLSGNPSPSPPGSPPGRRSGHLRNRWSLIAKGSGGDMVFGIKSGVHYSPYLEYGTRKMAARPFVDKIVETAKPEIDRIFSNIGG